MNVALVYDRIVKWGGAERVLLALHELFPDAPLYTAVYDREHTPWASVFDLPRGKAGIRTSFLQRFPFVRSHYEWFAWLMPFVFESFSFDEYDVVISVTSAEAKGIITKPRTRHLCYCLTPTRYLWSHYEDYFHHRLFRTISRPAVSSLRKWDYIAAQRPDHMIAISHAVQQRIKKYYGRDSEVIYPPVDLKLEVGNSNVENEVRKKKSDNRPSNIQPQHQRSNLELPTSYYLVVSRLVPYKKIDLAILAFNRLQLPLVIIGSGHELERLKRMAGPSVKFLSDLTEDRLNWYYRHCRAFILPQEEDFGIAAVEAQMHGKPVIAFHAGGSLDTVKEGETGIFFHQQTENALIDALHRFDKMQFVESACRRNAERFSKERFMEGIRKIISKK